MISHEVMTMVMVLLHGRKGQTYIASITSDGLSEIARLGGESRGGCCEEREEGCEEMHDGFEMVVMVEYVGGDEDLGCS
jgi:hypothetical protein